MALVSEHRNRTLFILTLVRVLALPINVVAALLGMDVDGIPLAQHPGWVPRDLCGPTVVTCVLALDILLRWGERGNWPSAGRVVRAPPGRAQTPQLPVSGR
ncbi:MAG TPA: CorA family divalent cation transporter [Steroidobacteraceae bacterium]|jgi:Mg2+ and Co2+ transporter CorA